MARQTRSLRRSALVAAGLFACSLHAAGQAKEEADAEPLASELIEARTIVLLDTTMDFALSSRFRDALEEWGRFEIVFTPDEADVCIALSTRADYTKEEVESGRDDQVSAQDEAQDSEDPLGNRAVGTARVMEKLYLRVFIPGSGDDLWLDEEDVDLDDEAADILIERLRDRLEGEPTETPAAS